MAYNNGFPATYQPMYYQPQYQPQQQYQQPQYQQQPTATNQPSIIWISNESEALSYPVAPNNAVTLWSTMEPVVYLKKADATGKPSLQTFDLVERAQSPSKGGSAQGKETVEYAEKSDVVALAGVVKGFDDLMNTMRNDIETMKGDLYGVAGRKKTRKPKEETEDDD